MKRRRFLSGYASDICASPVGLRFANPTYSLPLPMGEGWGEGGGLG